MNKNMRKGFTLIELLVVISIIGILSSVVLAALNSARDKGGNSAVKSQLHNLRSQASLICGDGSALCTSVCSDTIVGQMLTAARSSGGGTPANSPLNCGNTAWAASVRLKTPENGNAYWCVDSTGSSRGINSIPGGTVCP